MLALFAACDEAPVAADTPTQVEAPDQAPQLESLARSDAPSTATTQTPGAMTRIDPAPKADVAPRKPVTTRIARQMLVLRASPDHDAAIRGRIPISEAFHVYAFVEGKECGGKGWGDVGQGAFVCLEPTRPAGDEAPRQLPEMRDGGLAPFYYAKVKAGQAGRRWKNLASWQAGEPNMDVLEPEHDYAFTNRRRVSGELVLIDADGRVVLESEVSRYRPSRFEGRDLVANPVPTGRTLAWGVTWPENPVLTTPSESAPLAASIDYQAEILLLGKADNGFWAVDGGFIDSKHLGVWQLPVPPADVADDEIWIDVELDSQTLTVMRGATPLFATLVSTGFKGPTPKGLFRISMKQAIGQMQSRPDAEESYNVEAVPFVQYFTGNFALHGAFWHYRFGHKISHGCVNLSPKDARRVYEMTAPHAELGWLHAFEAEGALGSTVRVRKGDSPVEDKRDPPRRFDG
jgi:lipoprotein-anchoring transpeptidase ErfK/SrfK